MLKCLLLFGLSAIAVFAQQATAWVPYSAAYTEIVNETDSSGHTLLHEEKSGQEIRSTDGSQLTTVVVAGRRIKGRLWLGCGQLFNIDYSRKKAALESSSPRKHPQMPPDAPQGTITLGGVEFTAYPVHLQQSGSGTVWVDMNQDIVAKLEIHLNQPNGGRYDSIRELTSLDLNSPIDETQMKVPAQFAVDTGKQSAGCNSPAPEK